MSSGSLGAAVQHEYERAAGGYDARWQRYNRESLALLRPFLAGRALGTVLDVGCGTGNLLPLLVAWGARADRYVGVDPSAAMLRVARGKRAQAPGIPAAFVAAEAEAPPFRAASFDTVASASALHYWASAARGLGEIHRVLRPGGRLLLLDWSRDSRRMRVLNAAMRLARVPYARMYEQAEVATLLHFAGLHVTAELHHTVARVWGLMLFEAVKE